MFTAANTELSVKSAELMCMTKVFSRVEKKKKKKYAQAGSSVSPVLCHKAGAARDLRMGQLHCPCGKIPWQCLLQDPSVCPC